MTTRKGLLRTLSSRKSLLSILILLPTVGVFCLHFDSPRESTLSRAAHSEEPKLEPMRPFLTQSLYGESLRPIPNPRFAGSSATAQDPFPSGITRDMIAAQGDPFLLAYMSGRHTGRLVPVEASGGVVTLGPSMPRTGPSRGTPMELLRQIDLGLGGSRKSFLSKVLSSPAKSLDRVASGETELGDENPFLKALETNAAAPAAEKVEAKPVEPAAAPPKETTPPPAPAKETAPPPKPSIGGGGPVVTHRPYTLLRVEGGSTLRAIAASRPRENVLESVELGVRDFNVFSFTDPAEYPMSMAASDLNGDGHADLAVHIPGSGAIRVYLGGADGKFSEQLRIQASRFPSSLVSGDFDRDGVADLAISGVGTGLVTILYGDGGRSFERYRVFWTETYRDYLAIVENSATGAPELAGLTFAQRGQALIDFTLPEGKLTDRRIEFSPAHSSEVSTYKGRSSRLQGVLLNSRLSVNVDNRSGQLTNIINVSARTDVYVVVGDLNAAGTLDVGLAIPR